MMKRQVLPHVNQWFPLATNVNPKSIFTPNTHCYPEIVYRCPVRLKEGAKQVIPLGIKGWALSLCLSLSLSVCLSLSVPLCLSLSVCLSLCLSVSLSVCLSVCLFVCLSVCLSLSLSPPSLPKLPVSRSSLHIHSLSDVRKPDEINTLVWEKNNQKHLRWTNAF